jgi:hypothetical protein
MVGNHSGVSVLIVIGGAMSKVPPSVVALIAIVILVVLGWAVLPAPAELDMF